MTMDLSSHDKTVLNRVFNPEDPNDDGEDLELKALEDLQESSLGLSKKTICEIKSAESDAVKDAEKGDYNLALEKLSRIITGHPGYASSYNNRAQVYQLIGDKEAALNDIEIALKLTHGHGLVACQAYTQRGVLHKLEENIDAATEDFRKAAALGSKFARKILIEMNPYAALCNQMLKQVISELKTGCDINE